MVSMPSKWPPAEPDIAAVTAAFPDPLLALSRAEIPAIVLRQLFPVPDCDGLIDRFIQRGLMRDPRQPPGEGERTRIDIGTSLGNRGNDQAAFFEHAAETLALFEQLFDGFANPVHTVYDHLSRLAPGKSVGVACEPDGRRYGPAIFRIHYGGHAYKPHFDHVTLREKRFDYAVTRFEHQFAGILCLRNSSHRGQDTQAILHNCLWTEEVQANLDRFPEFAAERDIGQYRIGLEPGDLYFFNTRLIHEVPAIEGSDPRVVLAVFIGYSPDDGEVFVWS